MLLDGTETIKFDIFTQFLYAVVEWANDALQGLGKGAPFSLCLTQNYFSRVASGYGKDGNEFTTVSLKMHHSNCLPPPDASLLCLFFIF